MKIYKFTSETCGPCKMVAGLIDQYPNVTEFNSTFDPFEFKKYKVSSVPTVIILKDEEEIIRFVGVGAGQNQINKQNLDKCRL